MLPEVYTAAFTSDYPEGISTETYIQVKWYIENLQNKVLISWNMRPCFGHSLNYPS